MMVDNAFKVERDKVFLKIWLTDGARVDGFAHMPKNIREQDFLELDNKRMLALTNATLYLADNVSEHKVVIIHRDHIKMVIPQ